jgi:hypothetical protein
VDTSFLSVLDSTATVAVIVVATRWMVGVKGAQLPKSKNGTNVYGIKWHIRALGFAAVILSVAFSVWSQQEQHHVERELVMAIVFFLLGVWPVSTTQTSITKKVLWRSLCFRWDQVTEVRLHKRDGGAIELRAGLRKLIVDSRFVACEHLLSEIRRRTQLQPVRGLNIHIHES